MPDPCDITCSYPCARDHRTKREKIEAKLAPNSGASEGERRNARSMLASMKPDAPRAAPTQTLFDRTTRTTATGTVHGWTQYPSRDQKVREQEAAARLARAREQMRRMSTADLGDFFRRWSDQFSVPRDEFVRPYPYRNDPTDPLTPQDIKEAVCKLGGHDWVVIGQSMMHTDIKRCASCGEYDPPRKERKNGP